jgi:hypothetical protein
MGIAAIMGIETGRQVSQGHPPHPLAVEADKTPQVPLETAANGTQVTEESGFTPIATPHPGHGGRGGAESSENTQKPPGASFPGRGGVKESTALRMGDKGNVACLYETEQAGTYLIGFPVGRDFHQQVPAVTHGKGIIQKVEQILVQIVLPSRNEPQRYAAAPKLGLQSVNGSPHLLAGGIETAPQQMGRARDRGEAGSLQCSPQLYSITQVDRAVINPGEQMAMPVT